MVTLQGRTRTIIVASVGVGLAVGGGMVFMHRKFKSRLRLIAEKVELMEDQICDLKDLVSDLINEEHAGKIEFNLQQQLHSKNTPANSEKHLEEINEDDDDDNEDDDEFLEALEGFESLTSGDDREGGDDSDYGRDGDDNDCIEGGKDDDEDDDDEDNEGGHNNAGRESKRGEKEERERRVSKRGEKEERERRVSKRGEKEEREERERRKKDISVTHGLVCGGVSEDEERGGVLARVDELFEEGDDGRLRAYSLLVNHPVHSGASLWRLSKATFYLSKLSTPPPPAQPPPPLPSPSPPPLSSPPPPSSSPSSPPSPPPPPLLLSSPRLLIYEALRLSSEALLLDETCADAHKWYAITLGSTNDYESIKVRIQNGHAFKEHILRAIQLRPSDPSNHHLLGRWSYGVCMLSWVERKVAATLFSTPPTSTINEALHHFLKAEDLKKGGWKENQLFICKSYVLMSKYTEASEWMRKCSSLPCVTHEDQKSHEELQNLRAKYSSYLQP